MITYIELLYLEMCNVLEELFEKSRVYNTSQHPAPAFNIVKAARSETTLLKI